MTSEFVSFLYNLQAAVHIIVCSGITGYFDDTSVPICGILDQLIQYTLINTKTFVLVNIVFIGMPG